MEIRNNAEALKAFLGVTSAASSQAQIKKSESNGGFAEFAGDQATLSHAGTEISQAVSLEGVRTEKVAAIQQALATGNYSVPSAKVAEKVIDSMFGGAFFTGK